MSEENTTEAAAPEAAPETKKSPGNTVKLAGLYAHKVGMISLYDDNGVFVPATVLKVDPWVVSQIKTKEADGYEAVQISSRPTKAKNSDSAKAGHSKKAGLETAAALTKEIRQKLPEGIALGQKVDLDTLAKGDSVKLTGVSKGRGFGGVVARHGFAGGPMTHGSSFHRAPGSMGNRTWPGQVMPGKKLPGHYGDETVSLKSVKILSVDKEENVILVKGPVPGARNSLVRLLKV